MVKDPQTFSFQNIRAYMKQFVIGEKNWRLIIIFEFKNPELLRIVEKKILDIVINKKDAFERFTADTNEISSSVQRQIIKKLQSIPCPYLQRKIFSSACKLNSNIFKMHKCSIITTSACKEIIKEQPQYKSENTLYVQQFPEILNENWDIVKLN